MGVKRLTSQKKRAIAKSKLDRDYKPVNKFGKLEPPQLDECQKAAGLKICKQCYYDGRPYIHPVNDFFRRTEDGPRNGSLFALCKSCTHLRRQFERDKKTWLKRYAARQAKKKDLEEKGFYDEAGNQRHELFGKENEKQKE